MVDKVMIFNIALDALRLLHRTSDPDNDNEKSVKTLRLMFPVALSKTLADLDLNGTSTKVKLEEMPDEHPHWERVYKYPADTAKFRRIVSPLPVDNRNTRIPFATESINGVKVILTNEPAAWGEIIPFTLNLSLLSPAAAYAVGYNLASLSASLIVGKGSTTLSQTILQNYMLYKAEAMEHDLDENLDYTRPEFDSELAQARMGGGLWRSKIT